VVDLVSLEGLILHSQNFEGKFGRILGDFEIQGEDKLLTDILLTEGHAIKYGLDDREQEKAFVSAREKLIEAGKVSLPK